MNKTRGDAGKGQAIKKARKEKKNRGGKKEGRGCNMAEGGRRGGEKKLQGGKRKRGRFKKERERDLRRRAARREREYYKVLDRGHYNHSRTIERV